MSEPPAVTSLPPFTEALEAARAGLPMSWGVRSVAVKLNCELGAIVFGVAARSCTLFTTMM